MSELKSCPFCGGKARIMLEEEDKPDECFHNVYCTNCGAQFWVKSKSKAIAAWNRRVPAEVVVHCGECKHGHPAENAFEGDGITPLICCGYMTEPNRPYEFCSWGERREDGKT